MLPVPVDLEEKTKTSIVEQQDREKRCVPERETVQWVPVEIISHKPEEPQALREMTYNEPTSDRSNRFGGIGDSAVVDTETEVISEHRETTPPNVMSESLPVFPDLSSSDSSRDEECFVSEPCEEVSVDRTNEGTAARTLGRRDASPVNKEESEWCTTPRRSQRHREQPERLQYGQLGNPLLSIVQSHFQGLNLAFEDALLNHGYADTPQMTPRPFHRHVDVMGHTHL